MLRYLAENADHLLSKEELIQSVWPDIFVTDDALVQCIKDIREALSDNARQIIKTVPRRGYLFAAKILERHLENQAPTNGRQSQEITFCRTRDSVDIAVACVGKGMPLVSIPTWLTNVECDWEGPRAPLWRFLAERFQLVRYDGRGFGLSDRGVTDISFATFEQDLDAVVDALGLRCYALLGISQGAATAIAHAARNPDRVRKLAILGGFALGRNVGTSASGAEMTNAVIAILRQGFGDENSALLRIFSSFLFPGASVEQVKWYANLLRVSTSVETAVRNWNACANIDVGDLLPKVAIPTLVMHCRHDNAVPFEEGRRLAKLIPKAKFVSLDSENHSPLLGEPAWQEFIGELAEFLSD